MCSVSKDVTINSNRANAIRRYAKSFYIHCRLREKEIMKKFFCYDYYYYHAFVIHKKKEKITNDVKSHCKLCQFDSKIKCV